MRIARQQHPRRQVGVRSEVQWWLSGRRVHGADDRCAVWDTARAMAKRRSTPPPVPDAVREAVERTVQATLGQAAQAQQETRGRAQVVVDDVVKGARTTRGRAQEAVEGVVKGAEVVGERARRAIEDARPATHDDLKELKGELRAIGRRLDAIESRLPASKPAARRAKPKPKPKSKSTKKS